MNRSAWVHVSSKLTFLCGDCRCSAFLNSAAPDTESSAASGPQAGGRDKTQINQVKERGFRKNGFGQNTVGSMS